MENIVLIGSSGHAKVIIDIIEKKGVFNISGLIDSFRDNGEEILGYKIIGSEADLPELISKYELKGAILAIGDNNVRAKVASSITEISPELPFLSAIHPDAVIGKDVVIGDGAVIMAGAIMNPSAAVGNFCIVNTKASLGHDSVMEDFSSLGPGVTAAGNCRIGGFSAVSIGACVRHGVLIGEHTIIGGGSSVMESIEPFCVAYGVPAKKIRERKKDDKYL